MYEKGLISIIIPVYNVEQYLRQCLDSVINQTYKNLEIILVDDGSTDNSGKICDEYALRDNRIKVIHKQNAGVSCARNIGLKIAEGNYIGFVDSDDYIELDMYEYLYEMIIKNNADISMCQVDYIKGNKTIYKTLLNEDRVLTSNMALELLYTQMYVVNKLFKKNIISGLFFSNDIYIAEDMLFCLDYLKKSKQIIYGKQIKYHYINNVDSATQKSFNINKLTYFKIINVFINYVREKKLKQLYRKLKEQEVYHAVGFLKQIVECDFKDKRIIKSLQNIVREKILLHLFSNHKLSNKLFGICVCINFNLTKKLYKLLN